MHKNRRRKYVDGKIQSIFKIKKLRSHISMHEPVFFFFHTWTNSSLFSWLPKLKFLKLLIRSESYRWYYDIRAHLLKNNIKDNMIYQKRNAFTSADPKKLEISFFPCLSSLEVWKVMSANFCKYFTSAKLEQWGLLFSLGKELDN